MSRLSAALLLLLLFGCSSAPNQLRPPTALGPYQALEERFGIELRPLQAQSNFPWWFPLAVTYTPISDPDTILAAFTPEELAAELEKYPPNFFRHLGLKGIYWGQNVESGLFTWRLPVGGVGFNLQGERWVVLDLPVTPQARPLPAHTLHHEIFHTLDNQEDQHWNSCNPSHSSYGIQPPETVRREFDYPSPGFVSSYARTEAREDRAEVFALMMTNPTYAQLLQHWQISDVYLRCKQQFISQQLQATSANFDQAHLNWVALGLTGEALSQAQNRPEQITTLNVQGYNPTGKYTPLHADSHHPNPFALPDQIGQLSGLQILRLKNTDHTELPASFGSLRQLHTLTLEGQRLQHFPKALLLLQQLTHLSLRNSGLTEIPEELLDLPQLQTLDISENVLPEPLRQSLRHKAQRQGIQLSE